jgi:chromosome segregation ATPase
MSLFNKSDRPSREKLEERIVALTEQLKNIDSQIIEKEENLTRLTALDQDTEPVLNELTRLEGLARTLPGSLDLIKNEIKQIDKETYQKEAEANRARVDRAVKKIKPFREAIEAAKEKYMAELESLDLSGLRGNIEFADALLKCLSVIAPQSLEEFRADVVNQIDIRERDQIERLYRAPLVVKVNEGSTLSLKPSMGVTN